MTYYFFSINPIFRKLMTNYELYKTLDDIQKEDNLRTQIDYQNLVTPIDEQIAKDISRRFRYSINFTQDNNCYHYDSNYLEKNFHLFLKNTYLYYQGNHLNTHLIKILHKYNLFVCNFKNKDYFWTGEEC